MGNSWTRTLMPTTVWYTNTCIKCKRSFECSFRSGICPSCHQSIYRTPTVHSEPTS